MLRSRLDVGRKGQQHELSHYVDNEIAFGGTRSHDHVFPDSPLQLLQAQNIMGSPTKRLTAPFGSPQFDSSLFLLGFQYDAKNIQQ